MAGGFGVLASGSSGNSAILQADGRGLLLDFGIGPRTVASRLSHYGLSWRNVHAAILTHTHRDHWNDRTLAHLRTLRIPLYCHEAHLPILHQYGTALAGLNQVGLLHVYDLGEEFSPIAGVTLKPFLVPHDSVPTCGFRIEGGRTLFGSGWAVGYASDLGVAPPELIEQFRDVDLIALEFNHDYRMQTQSRRPKMLIDRCLSEKGHLSNLQAQEAVIEVLQQSRPGLLRHLVMLHLSRECNLPGLAVASAQKIIDAVGKPFRIHASQQDQPTKWIDLAAS